MRRTTTDPSSVEGTIPARRGLKRYAMAMAGVGLVAGLVTVSVNADNPSPPESNEGQVATDDFGVYQSTVGQCRPDRVRFKTAPRFPAASTTSSSFSPIADMTVNFRQGGAGNQCVIVNFTAEVETLGNSNMEIRAVMPGVGVAEPGPVLVGRQDSLGIRTRASMQFVFPNVPPGQRQVRVAFRRFSGSETVFVNARSVTVHHRAP